MVRWGAFFRVVFGRHELVPEGHRTMWTFIKDLFLGEPAVSLGIISTGLAAWVAALIGMGEAVPLWLAIAAPVSSAIGAGYTRQLSQPLHPSPFSR